MVASVWATQELSSPGSCGGPTTRGERHHTSSIAAVTRWCGTISVVSRRLLSKIAVVVLAVGAASAVVVPSVASRPEISPVSTPVPEVPQRTYVALGSSYASGPDLSAPITGLCMRTVDNYPQQVARALHMRLIDASCSGATTENIVRVAQRRASAPQIDAVRPDTALVTVTSGGNDVGYIARLLTMSCANVLDHAIPSPLNTRHECAGRRVPPEPDAAAYDGVRRALVRTVQEIHARAPHAKVVVVDYPPVTVAGESLCSRLPLTAAEAAETVRVFDALAAATAAAAQESGAQLVRASQAGASHTVCSAQPWLHGFSAPIPYHPDARGKSGVADLVVDSLGGPVR